MASVGKAANLMSSPDGPVSWLRIVVGIACLILGIAALAWPDLSLVVLAVILGLQLVIAGVAQIVVGLRLRTGPSWVRPLVVVLGGLVALAGIIVMVRPGPALVVIVWFVAGAWLINGVSEIISGLRTGRSGGERIMTIAFGVTGVIAALILFVFPGPSLILLSRITGVVLIVLGILALAGAVLARRSPQTIAA
jgi:uncharacterized membrane protein HdeD (DUF308 family)